LPDEFTRVHGRCKTIIESQGIAWIQYFGFSKRSLANADRSRDSLSQLKFCLLLNNYKKSFWKSLQEMNDPEVYSIKVMGTAAIP